MTDPLLRRAIEAVRQGASLIAENWRKPRTITHKGRIDLLTETDPAVEARLMELLDPLVPGATFLAEESASTAELADATWIIDPLDGTTNFAHGLPMVASSVGLWRGGAVELGIVYNPILDEMFAARRGQGAWLNGEPINVSNRPTLVESVIGTGFPYAIVENKERILDWLGRVLPATQGVRRYGAAAVDLAYLACGRLDGFYEAALNPWDVAAGWCLIEAAGGRVSALDHTQPYELGADVILASNGHIHEALGALLTE